VNTSNYEEKLRVMRVLLDSGLTHKSGPTKIKVGDVEVTRTEYAEAIRGVPININVSAQASAMVSTNISFQIKEVIKQLQDRHIDPVKLKMAKAQLTDFEAELKRQKPRWPQIRKILRWSLSLGEEIFCRLVVLWAQRYMT